MESEAEQAIELSPSNRYVKLNVVLGKGAYKVVYKALDREEGYEVAWNVCQTKKAEFMELSQEIQILKRVRHPNIIQFHDCWFFNNEFVFITELMTSGTLREYIRKLQIPNLKIVKRWARQILKGLSYLHSHHPPIIHRDIKCDNIFINGAHGEVKIGDMGSAKMKLGKKYTVIGTPEFLAPEMYEEKGYSEKVDIYAFGMALLEMVTGEYPYSECKNAAQIYKKVTQGIKPECLSCVTDPEVLDLINNCIGAESERLSAKEIIEHPFLAVEPEVILLVSEKTHLTMQVVFKGMDKLSVKFEFNTDTDTAEELVNEMIHEQVLPAKYQHLITGEINQILRELKKAPAPPVSAVDQQPQYEGSPRRPSFPILEKGTTSGSLPAGASNSPDPGAGASDAYGTLPRKASQMADDFDFPLKEYYDEDLIELIVEDTAYATKRGAEKAAEWLDKLHKQDIVTVGDLRDLQEEDWANLGLTVFANRALKNALYGKPARNVTSVASKSGTLSRAGSTTSNSNTASALPPPALPPS